MTAPAGTTVTRTATATATATAPAGPAPCVASDLALSFLGQQGGMGQGLLGFALKNTTAAGCRTGGYPGIEFLGPSGQRLPTTASRSTGDFIGPTPVARILLGPGQSASFRLVVGHGAASTHGCTTASGLQVIAPNDTATLRATIPDGAYECGSAAVSPLRPGGSAYP